MENEKKQEETTTISASDFPLTGEYIKQNEGKVNEDETYLVFQKEYVFNNVKKYISQNKDSSSEKTEETVEALKKRITDSECSFDDYVEDTEKAIQLIFPASEGEETPTSEEAEQSADEWAEKATNEFATTGKLRNVFDDSNERQQVYPDAPITVQRFNKISYTEKSAEEHGMDNWIQSKMTMLRKQGII